MTEGGKTYYARYLDEITKEANASAGLTLNNRSVPSGALTSGVSVAELHNLVNREYQKICFDVTHALGGRQNKSSQADTKSQGIIPIKAAPITIAKLLKIVNGTHQSILSDDVLTHLNETRNPKGDYTGKVKFSSMRL